jgi:hypothetical protein
MGPARASLPTPHGALLTPFLHILFDLLKTPVGSIAPLMRGNSYLFLGLSAYFPTNVHFLPPRYLFYLARVLIKDFQSEFSGRQGEGIRRRNGLQADGAQRTPYGPAIRHSKFTRKLQKRPFGNYSR